MTESPTASCGSWSCSKEQNLGKGLKNDLDVGSIFPFFHPQKIPERNKWLGTATNVAPALETMVELSALASNPQDTCRLGEIFGVCVGNLGKNGRLGKHQDSCFGTLFWTNSKKVSIWFNVYIYIYSTGTNNDTHSNHLANLPAHLAWPYAPRKETPRSGPLTNKEHGLVEPHKMAHGISSLSRGLFNDEKRFHHGIVLKMKLNHSKRENDLKLERIDEHLFAPGLRFKWLNVSKLSSGRHSCLKYKHHA